jgi:hypothetical protein
MGQFSQLSNPIGFKAGADLSTSQYRFMKLNSSGEVIRCSVEGEASIGVLQNDPKAGESATIAPIGSVSRVEAGEALNPNVQVMTGADGRALAVTGDNTVLGLTCGTKAAGAAGQNVSVLLDTLGDANAGAVFQALDDAGIAGYIEATAGTQVGDDIEVACELTQLDGSALAEAREVLVTTLALTDGKGDLSAAGTPVGTLVKAHNPATGANLAWMLSTAAGLFAFSVENDVAEVVLVKIEAEGCFPLLLRLTFT